MLIEKSVRLQCLPMYFLKRRNIVVPFEQRGGGTTALDGSAIQIPYLFDDRMVVRVEGVLLEFGVAGDVDLRDPLCGDAIHIFDWIEGMVARGDVDVIHVEENATVGAFDDVIGELPLERLCDVELGV